MPMRDPVAAYIAASNIEAHLVCNLLIDEGIEAAVQEDVSQLGATMFGLASQLHRPKIWVERVDLGRAEAILHAYEDALAARRAVDQRGATSSTNSVSVTCEDCGATSMFPSEQRGSVQTCPKCQGYVDVGDDEPGFDWK